MITGEAAVDSLLAVRDLSVHFISRGRRRPPVRAVDGVGLTVAGRETVGIVGESGSGKTTLGRAILGMTPITAGSVQWMGEDITSATHRRRRELSGELQVVFQDPYSSLNPTRTIGQTLREMLHGRREMSRRDIGLRVSASLEQVGLTADAAARFPSSFSGGQRQRIAIARALIVEPRLVICDEPVTALDLSVQAQVLNLLRDLRQSLGLSYLFIAHDLDVVRYVSDRVLVLYRGQVVEEGVAEELYTRPAHPYTRALLEAAPIPDPTADRPRRVRVATHQPNDPTTATILGCPFAPRCPHRSGRCLTERPALEPGRDGGSRVACHHWREVGTEAPISSDPNPGTQAR
jgi:oligopeptide/dipeptide ABC transporter ATP-binding protein